jgi:hypothetical protein
MHCGKVHNNTKKEHPCPHLPTPNPARPVTQHAPGPCAALETCTGSWLLSCPPAPPYADKQGAEVENRGWDKHDNAHGGGTRRNAYNFSCRVTVPHHASTTYTYTSTYTYTYARHIQIRQTPDTRHTPQTIHIHTPQHDVKQQADEPLQ